VDDRPKSEVAEAASTAVDKTVDKTQEVARDAAEQAKGVAETAREQAAEVGHEVGAQAQRVVEEAKDKLREQGEQQSAQIASALRGFSDQAQALAEGRPQDAGALGGYAEQAAGKVAEVADRVEARGIEGALDDLKTFARRRPGVFLLGAGIAGFAAGRLLRGATAPTPPDTPLSTSAAPGGYVPYQRGYQPSSVGAPSAVGIETRSR
jgi:hypothetical protein